MKVFLSFALFLYGSGAYASDCGRLQPRFEEYRQAVSAKNPLASFFSRQYLEEQVDGLLVDGDESVLTHNAKVVVRRARIPRIGDQYSRSFQCKDHTASVTLVFPRGQTKSIILGYVYEDGAWRIGTLEFDISASPPAGI